MASGSAGPHPWRLGHLLALYATAVVGAVVVVVAWWGASGAVRPADQMVWINVGAVGTMLAGAGIGVWLLTGRWAVVRRRRALLADAPATFGSRRIDEVAFDEMVAVAATTRYHRPNCQLVAGKPARADTAASHETAGRRPCGICRP